MYYSLCISIMHLALCINQYALYIMHYALYIYSIHNALCIFKFITVLDNFSQRKWHPTRHKLCLFCMHLCVCMHFSLCIMHYASCNIYCDICITEFITIIDRISHLKWHPTRPNLYWFFIPWIIHYALCIMQLDIFIMHVCKYTYMQILFLCINGRS